MSRRSMGFSVQNAALFDSITVGENVAFPMRRHTDWSDAKIRDVARAKLADVDLETRLRQRCPRISRAG